MDVQKNKDDIKKSSDLSPAVEAQTLRIQALTIAFNGSVKVIELLKHKLAALEKSSHGGLQHGRGWNISKPSFAIPY